MHTKKDIKADLRELGFGSNDSVLIHSSLKSLGEVENRAHGFIDALEDFFADGLVVLPTFTWDTVNKDHPEFDVIRSESSVGALTNIFMGRPNAVRSWHPTHSVAAIGRDAKEFVEGHERFDTPFAWDSPLGRLCQRGGKILFIGTTLLCNSMLHAIEEWMRVPNRMTETREPLVTITPDGRRISVPSRRHIGGVSRFYGKMEAPMLELGIAKKGRLCDANVYVVDAVRMLELTKGFLSKKPDLFGNGDPVDAAFYR